ncbi:MAG: SAM-dependent chlorinase/fluorinase [Aquificae bacterium]|nr:SAM-dependent chlorinase/fluorinase [Aquificota bacterium]
MGVLVFLTDFGTKDGFAGVMKGVALSINPDLRLVDLTHEVEPFNVLEGALLLKAHYRYFPKGSAFVAVVDPGVGTERKPIAVKTPNYYFVGPMNGLFDLVLEEEKPLKVVELTNPRYRLPAVNDTFHGRDVFTPAAAHLLSGVPLERLGPPVRYRRLLNFPKPKRLPGKVVGQVVYFDRFGNAVTTVPCGRYRRCTFRGKTFPFVRAFLEAKRYGVGSTCGSFGLVELFVPEGNFKETFGARKGEKVVCHL